jgi:hypothetical protein
MTTALRNHAYQAENLPGSCLTAPLKAYNRWFEVKLASSEGPCQKLAYKVLYAVSSIFAYPIFGVLALIGTERNLNLLDNDRVLYLYSGVPAETIAFCAMELHAQHVWTSGELRNTTEIPAGGISSTREYTYLENKRLFFSIRDIERNPNQNEEEWQFDRFTHSGPLVDEAVENVMELSKQHGWIPDPNSTRLGYSGDKFGLIIYIPDQVPLD